MRAFPPLAASLLAAVVVAACTKRDSSSSMGEITVRSPAFGPGGAIPAMYAGPPEGQGVSPPLAWSGVPPQAQELVVVAEEVFDYGKPFVLWVAYGISGTAQGLPAGIPVDTPTAEGIVQGTNDFGHLGWGGPEPKHGEAPHHYTFWVYALDAPLRLEPGQTKTQVMDAAHAGGHILKNGRVVGTYGR